MRLAVVQGGLGVRRGGGRGGLGARRGAVRGGGCVDGQGERGGSLAWELTCRFSG